MKINDWSDNTMFTARKSPLLIAMQLLLPAALCLATTAHAQTADIPVPPKPSTPYPGDHIGVPLLGGGNCSAAFPDPARKPQIRLIERVINNPNNPASDTYSYEVDYWLVNDPDAICGLPPPPGYYYADIGALPVGWHSFAVTGMLEGEAHATYQTGSAYVQVHERPGNEISGIWFAPEQSGRGFTVVRSGYLFALYWAAHDAEGEPTWVTLLLPDTRLDDDANGNTFTGTAINTSGSPLAAGAATLEASDWGTVQFSYEGCGRATFTWDAIDPAIGDGSQSLMQVAVPDGIERCDVAALSNGLVAEWVETPTGEQVR